MISLVSEIDPIDSFEQVLSDPEHCYCVILNAHDGAAFPEETESKNPGSNVQPGLNCGSAQEKPPKVPSLVFQNYVYEAFCLSRY